MLDYAIQVAERATCPHRPAGAVLELPDGTLVSGYQGAPRGQAHCDLLGCEIDLATGHCARAVCAELNAVLQAARDGRPPQGATLYVSLTPNYRVFPVLVNAGIAEIVYPSSRPTLAPELHVVLDNARIRIRQQ